MVRYTIKYKYICGTQTAGDDCYYSRPPPWSAVLDSLVLACGLWPWLTSKMLDLFSETHRDPTGSFFL